MEILYLQPHCGHFVFLCFGGCEQLIWIFCNDARYSDNGSNISENNANLKSAVKPSPNLHIPQELRIRSRGTERHSASN